MTWRLRNSHIPSGLKLLTAAATIAVTSVTLFTGVLAVERVDGLAPLDAFSSLAGDEPTIH